MNWAACYLLKCAELKGNTELQPHQQRVIDKIKQEPGLLVYHEPGTGKTLASIGAGEELGGPRQVVVPASLRENYKKELGRFVKGKPHDWHVQSYTQAVKHEELPEAALTVFDEAQRMGRSGTQMSMLPEQAKGKVMMLSGTPVRNSPGELYPLLRGIARDRAVPATAKAFNDRFVGERSVFPGVLNWLRGVKPGVEPALTNTDELRGLLKGRVDYQPNTGGSFPKVKTEDVETEMTPQQSDLYEALLEEQEDLGWRVRSNLPPAKMETKKLNAFLNAVRQVSNNPAAYDVSLTGDGSHVVDHSPKMKRMVQDIQKEVKADPDFKGLIYSNYLESGVMPLAERLTQLGIPNAVFTGALSDQSRKKAVDAYNRGKVKVLLVSGAGAEGLDLKGTQMVQVMEPHWNQARIDQVIARAARHLSHTHLPVEKQNVRVKRYYANPRPGLLQRWGFKDKATGADRYIQELAGKKQNMVQQLLELLQEVGSE